MRVQAEATARVRKLRLLLLLLTISAGLTGLLFFELESGDEPHEVTRAATNEGRPAVQGNPVRPAAPRQTADKSVATILAQPLFSPTRRPPETVQADGPADPTLSDVRLTGIVIEPDRQLAIFAVKGAKPRTLSVGEALNGWKLDGISAEEVSLSGPGGTTTLQPKIDTTLVRQARLPAAPAQPAAGAPPGAPPTQPQAGAPPTRAPVPAQAAVPPVPARAGVPGQPVQSRPQVPITPIRPQNPGGAPTTNPGR
jgi:hypothetical protein